MTGARQPVSPSVPPLVLHRDDHYLVVVKPSGIPTTSPDGRGCLTELVRATLDPRAPHTHPSSRLDRDVSGVVIFARTDRGIRALLRAREDGAYVRRYVAIVQPPPSAPEGVWSTTIAIDPRDKRRRIVLAPGQTGERAQDARSRYRAVAVASGCALIEVWPETGRTHQIRVHAAHAGAPIVGDVTYGGPRRVVLPDGRALGAPRVMLHCFEVRVDGVGRFCAPLSADMAGLLGSLGLPPPVDGP